MNILKFFPTKVLLFMLLLPLFTFAYLFHPTKVDTASFTSASATMSNSRLSFLSRLNGTAAGGKATFIIKIGGGTSAPDTTINHLFSKDTVSIGTFNTGPSALTVNTTVGTTQFTTSTGLGTSAVDADPVFVAQRTYFTVSLNLATTVPANGYIKVSIPAVAVGSGQSDGIPDSNTTTATNGWDSSGVGTSDFSISGGTNCTWPASPTWTWTAGSSSTNHTVKFISTTSCNGGTITIGLGNTAVSTKQFINPAPITTHTVGTADTYKLNASSYDAADTLLDSTDLTVGPIEGVKVSATVDETLSFTIVGKPAGATACGQIQTSGVTTTAYSVPWGTISTANSFLNAGQGITISTNAASGYAVKVEENDQMGKDGVACVGASAGESVNCIKDTTCDSGTCSESSTSSWATATNNGLGYGLENISGSHNAFSYGSGLGTGISARQFPDQEASETKQTVMSHTGPVSGDAINVCYRISVSGTQPAGTYFNVVKYTATPIF